MKKIRVELLELLSVLLLNTLKGRKGSQNISDTILRIVSNNSFVVLYMEHTHKHASKYGYYASYCKYICLGQYYTWTVGQYNTWTIK